MGTMALARIEKDVWMLGSGSTTTTRFAYENMQTWADLSSTNSLQTQYLRGMHVLELLAWIANGGTVFWVLIDRMGSVRNVLDNSGASIDTITYGGYGDIINESSPISSATNKAFGYNTELELAVYRLWTRIYDPVTGRFTSRDPIGFAAGDSNLYRYVLNCPTSYVDPTGLRLRIPRWKDYALFEKLLNEMCPQGQWKFSYWQGVVTPTYNSFCTEKGRWVWISDEEAHRGKNRRCPRTASGGTWERVDGYGSTRYPVSCKCICDAINADYTITLNSDTNPGGYVGNTEAGDPEVYIGSARPTGYPGFGDTSSNSRSP